MWRRAVPMVSRVRRALKGLARARRERGVFHLWLHFEDLVPETGVMLGGLDAVLRAVAAAASEGSLEVLTMAGLAARMEQCGAAA